MTPKIKKIIIGIIILVVVFIAYALVKPDPTADVLVGNRNGAVGAVTTQQARLLSTQISQALLKIDQIRLDRSVFDNPIFKSLSDRSQNIEPEPIGRSNPFAPLGDTSVNSVVRDTPNIRTATSTATDQTASTTPGVVVDSN